jgi:anti-sigma factor RsiW
MTNTWHADTELLDRYASGTIDDAQASSIEAHLLACRACRSGLRGRVRTETLERAWAGVVDVMDTPRPGIVERGLRSLGVPDHVARLLAATPSLSLSWFAAEAIALGFAVIAADAATTDGRYDLGLLVFLVVAALLPVGGVAVAYGPGVDPTFEVAQSSPMRSYRLLLIRSTAVLVSSAVLAAAAALALPALDWRAMAWVLPSLGLTLATLALSTWLRPLVAAGGVTLAWIFASFLAASDPADRLVVFRGGGQIAFLVLVAVSVLALASRREALEQGVV